MGQAMVTFGTRDFAPAFERSFALAQSYNEIDSAQRTVFGSSDAAVRSFQKKNYMILILSLIKK